MQVKIVALGDIHYGPGTFSLPERRSSIADILLLKVVNRINRFIKPDIVFLLGDLIEDYSLQEARVNLERLAEIIARFDCPTITIPGNHDGDVEDFFNVIQKPPEIVDIKDVRFLPFIDPEEPDYSARRMPHDIARVAKARCNHSGKIVSLQHVPLFPRGTNDCPLNYTNAEEIISDFRKHGVALSIGAHYHDGIGLYFHEGVGYMALPALCEPPFPFVEILIDDNEITVRRHELQMPEEPALVDCHVHTQFAYCSEDMQIVKALDLADELGLAGIKFAEHSAQLYVNREEWLRGDYYVSGIDGIKNKNRRIEDYFQTARMHCPPESIGFEVTCDFSGRPVLDPEALSRAGFTLGAIHRLKGLNCPQHDMDSLCDEFLFLMNTFLMSGIQALAHPFRIFYRSGLETPERLFKPTVKMLREHGVVAELNFHGNEPPQKFFKMCIDSGARLALGSDSHSLWEVGELSPHLNFLKNIGFNGDLGDILIDSR